MLKTLKYSFALSLLLSVQAMAETPASTTSDNTIKVQNGVTVTSGTPPTSAITTPTAATPTPTKEAEPAKPAQEKLFMKPIVENSKSTPTKKKAEPQKKASEKEVEPAASPFKKSQDAGVKETVSKPDPSPEVSSKPLPADDKDKDSISDDIKKLDTAKSKDSSEKPTEGTTGESGLPIPRFVTLKSGEANARTGPGDTYPIRWVYQRKNLPVEITAEFKLWRRIKDFDGEQSWVHQALVSSNRYAILSKDGEALSSADGGSRVALFKRGVQVKLAQCKQGYCEVEYGHIEGWVKKKDLWGIYPDEKFD